MYTAQQQGDTTDAIEDHWGFFSSANSAFTHGADCFLTESIIIDHHLMYSLSPVPTTTILRTSAAPKTALADIDDDFDHHVQPLKISDRYGSETSLRTDWFSEDGPSEQALEKEKKRYFHRIKKRMDHIAVFNSKWITPRSERKQSWTFQGDTARSIRNMKWEYEKKNKKKLHLKKKPKKK